MKFKQLDILFCLIMSGFLFSLLEYSAYAQAGCQNKQLEGKYVLVKDSDGKTPKKGATITLTLSGNSAHLLAIMPGDKLESDGEFSACRNMISLSFEELEISVTQKPFSLTGNKLVLPFLALGGDGEGTSEWKKNIEIENQENENIADNEGNKDNNLVDVPQNDANKGDKNVQEEQNNQDKQDDEAGEDNKNESHRNNNQQDKDVNRDIDNNKSDNEYIGEYYGIGRGWEVRFKQTSGDFVAQFSGVKKDELPFQNDKIIMSLLVEHVTSFKINIDESGNATGSGEIVYNVIPNLCGLAILTEQVNAAVNLMGEFAFFLDLSSKIGQASVAKFEGTFLGLEGELAKKAKNVGETGLNLFYEYLGTKLPEKMKALDLEGQQGTALCNCAAGQAAIKGGNAVGPSTLKEMIGTFGVDVAKTLFMDVATGSLPVGLVLSIPGVTQIQYYYKGLQNGPETRKFNIKGKLVEGKLYLEMDGDVSGGPKQLTIEYMVNYKKETPTFPSWSPFLKEGATMYPGGSVVTVYNQETKTRTEKFKDAATGETKTIEIPYTVTTETKEKMELPYASFRKAGKQRNGVKVWHEYEYNWRVYKVSEEK